VSINTSVLGGLLVLALAAAWALAPGRVVVSAESPASTQLEGPACNDQEVVDFVADAFDATQEFETRSGLSLTALSEVHDLGASTYKDGAWRQIRSCSARASLSSGRSISSWHQIRLPIVEDAIGYRVKVCFEEFDPVSGGDCSAFRQRL
jgi:hypothetical protein